jgi:hypothetical protein
VAPAFDYFGPPELIPVLPVVGEHARKIVSLVPAYLATHFTASSSIERVGSSPTVHHWSGVMMDRGTRARSSSENTCLQTLE